MYKLFIANKNYSSWSLRPWILMTELNIPFEEILIPFSGKGEFLDHTQQLPSRKVPTLHDGDLKIWDSLAITEYIAEKHPAAWPQDSKQRALARSAASEMHSGFTSLRNFCSMNCGIRAEMKTIPAGLQRDLNRMSELLTDFLKTSGGPFLFGKNFTAVDAFFAPVAFRQQTYFLKFDTTTDEYFTRLRNLKGMQAWYQAALQETWVDNEHDHNILNHARVTQDFRSINNEKKFKT